jgi:spermidine/putrescine-binding protein
LNLQVKEDVVQPFDKKKFRNYLWT